MVIKFKLRDSENAEKEIRKEGTKIEIYPNGSSIEYVPEEVKPFEKKEDLINKINMITYEQGYFFEPEVLEHQTEEKLKQRLDYLLSGRTSKAFTGIVRRNEPTFKNLSRLYSRKINTKDEFLEYADDLTDRDLIMRAFPEESNASAISNVANKDGRKLIIGLWQKEDVSDAELQKYIDNFAEKYNAKLISVKQTDKEGKDKFKEITYDISNRKYKNKSDFIANATQEEKSAKFSKYIENVTEYYVFNEPVKGKYLVEIYYNGEPREGYPEEYDTFKEAKKALFEEARFDKVHLDGNDTIGWAGRKEEIVTDSMDEELICDFCGEKLPVSEIAHTKNGECICRACQQQAKAMDYDVEIVEDACKDAVPNWFIDLAIEARNGFDKDDIRGIKNWLSEETEMPLSEIYPWYKEIEEKYHLPIWENEDKEIKEDIIPEDVEEAYNEEVVKEVQEEIDKDEWKFVLKKIRNKYDEYVVKAYLNGRYNEDSTYYTDDWDDALGTLKAIAEQQNLTVKESGHNRFMAE